jgi:ribosome maturation protein Sdo1
VNLQVNECIKLIQTDSKLPIQRAKMRIRVVLPATEGQRLKETIFQSGDVEEDSNGAEEWGAVSTHSPSLIKADMHKDPPHRSITIPSDQRSSPERSKGYRPDRDSSNGCC